ncbi:glycoside hydrolase family 43 protein [Cohnella suwonensis]|uniref:Glycoside hydrolase family 43 protein n=1 Tax=Cohnella suwonensis TaxID=696072 RepID=A0ABW0LQS2_9BACL
MMAQGANRRPGLRSGGLAVLAATWLLAGCSDSGKGVKEVVPVYMNASVHDPSVIRAENGTYYVFGSHLAAAKSKDLMQWEIVASGVADGNPLIPNVTEELRETLDWAQTDTLWAADVIRLPDGKYYMYYNACRGDSPLSAMGVAVADDIEGPYRNLGIILKSGMWGEPSEDGELYDATVHPNVVDPDVFYDKDGQLWMVYGSYSGGIFILKMDETTGKPLPDQGYGTKLLGGNHSRIEGPYMQYSPDTGYYYLFLSYGGLDANGGYNIRVARSKNADGPFVDAQGHDMIDAKADPSLPLFDDKSIEPYGMKLMGNVMWRDPADAGREHGYVSPGHNSTYYDEESGRYYLIFHSRFPYTGDKHEIRVHQFFFNADGWPVVAPFRYAGEQLGEVKEDAAAGDYELVNHGLDISAELRESVSIRLEADGTISGAGSGQWALSGQSSLRLTVDGIAYDGYWLKSWDQAAGAWTASFTALSKEGVALWGAQRAAPASTSAASDSEIERERER